MQLCEHWLRHFQNVFVLPFATSIYASSFKKKHTAVDTRMLGPFKTHVEYDTLNETNSFKSILIDQVTAKAKELLEMGRGTSFESLIDATYSH